MIKILLFILSAVSTFAAIDVNVMLPLDVISMSMNVNSVDNLKSHLSSLKSAGVRGVMSDCWFGLVEKVKVILRKRTFSIQINFYHFACCRVLIILIYFLG